MDLDGFETLPSSNTASSFSSKGAKYALRHLDSVWFSRASRSARWMDLIGDYSGNEPFIIHGDSLLQYVLDDERLALGRDDDLSLQILHAKHSLERILSEILQRGDNFEVVFWDKHRHATLSSFDDPFVFTSRCLVRAALISHLRLRVTSVQVRIFQDVDDPEWQTYLRFRKPMFVMMNDGGVPEEDTTSNNIACIFLQRVLMFELMSQGLACALLPGAEFSDSKIMTFVFDHRPRPEVRQQLGLKFWSVAMDTVAQRNNTELATHGRFSPASVEDFKVDEVVNDAVVNAAVASIARRILSLMDRNSKYDTTITFIFAAHLLLLSLLAVGERARTLTRLHPALEDHLRNSFLPRALLAVEHAVPTNEEIDIDGRVFLDLLAMCIKQPSSFCELLGDALHRELKEIWTRCGSPAINFIGLSDDFYLSSTYKVPHANGAVPFSIEVMPFQHSLFEESTLVLKGVTTATSLGSLGQQQGEFNLPFADNQHWHDHRRAILPKHLDGEERVTLNDWQRKRQLRSEQRFVAKMQWQAESLTGALGKPLQQMIIVCDQSSRAKAMSAPGASETAAKKPTKPKKVHVSKADQIRQQHAAKKVASQSDSNAVWWKDKLSQLAQRPTAEQLAEMERLSNNRRLEEGWLAVEARLYKIHLHLLRWISRHDGEGHDKEAASGLRDHFTVQIMRLVKDSFERGGLFPAALQVLQNILQALGCSSLIGSFVANSPALVEDDRALSFKFVKLLRSKTKAPAHKFMPIVEDPVTWQLRLFGEYMDRSMDSQSDSRVSFKPDAWQRQVLDCLDDKGHSVLVVAPTSAGKTFISYYAMEQVLRASDDDVLVYIAPTKALVSQIAAEIYARFQKKFKANGKSVWAIHTRDYRVHNPQNCQILVTVPEMFAIMLLSPPLARVWTPRVKRIILDEIHTIGQQDGGAVWEQIILLAPCPIIGLSATIGEPERFNAWLSSVQEAHGYRHTFINHPHRYSHLRKFTYALHKPAPAAFAGLDTYQDSNRLRFLHPVSLLSFGPRNLPPDFSLEAADCLSLFHAFQRTKDALEFDVDELDPAKLLPGHTLLTQKDVLGFEAVLKKKLVQLMAASDSSEKGSTLSRIVRHVEDPVLAALPSAVQSQPAEAATILSGLIHLIADLRTREDLPALLFHFDRGGCEVAARTLLEALQEAEAEWRQTSPEWARKLQQWEAWQAQAKVRKAQEERLRKASGKSKSKKNKDDNDDDDEKGGGDAVEPAWQESFDPKDPNEQFSFLGRRCAKSLLEEAIRDIKWTETPQWVLDALCRGIGVHHSGMNKHYRTTVESLYRLGHLQVVIATGTLALGINAPTKTSVFCSDSPFLTALMYRQCAGRAGRRGFDLLGKVVFYGLPTDRVQRLVLSRLPALGGNFPLTSTMVLRLFNLLSGSADAPYAVRAVQSILRLPHVSFTSDISRNELTHHIRFSIDYLRRAALLDASGNPVNLFGLASHLYYTEPSNFAITALLRAGTVHKICGQPSLEKAKRELLHLLCHLFGRRNVPRAYTKSENVKKLLEKSPSRVILPPLSESAKDVLEESDAMTLKIFNGYAIAYANQFADDLGADQVLPLSRAAYTGDAAARDVPIVKHLRNTAVSVSARSSFVANSGHNDVFDSIQDLAQNTRDGIHIKEHGIPSFQHITTENTHALNSYLLDFYMHGQTQALVLSNGIRSGEIWFLLQDFMLTLKTIRASLGHMFSSMGSGGQEPGGEEETEGVFNPAEVDVEDDESGSGDGQVRPVGVADRDWRVYEVLHALTEDYDVKFRAMWA